jgi:hypothetical protein
MRRISDEILMAFADGELPPAAWRAVGKALQRDPALIGRLEGFILTKACVARPFDDVLTAPLPEKLLSVMRAASAPPAARRKSLRSPTTTGGRSGGRFRIPVLPLAAAATLLIGATIGWLVHSFAVPGIALIGTRGLVVPASLQHALERIPTGSSGKVAGNLILEPTFTFHTAQKIWCRQYELAHAGSGQRTGGLACRGGDGTWRVQVLAAASWKVFPRDTYVTAGSESTALGDQLLDAARASIMDGDVLGLDEEKLLIGHKWRPRS